MILALILAASPPPPLTPVPVYAAPDGGNQMIVSSSRTLAAWKTVPDCPGGLAYTQATQTFSCGGGGGGAPTTAQYWVGAADGTLSAEKNLGALSTGLVINTAGTPSAYAGNTCSVGQYASALSASGALTCSAVTPTLLTAAPIYLDAGHVSCGLAGTNTPGCVSGDAAGTQQFSGYKHYEQLLFADDTYSVAGLPTGVHVSNGGIAARSMTPATSGQAIELQGRRTWGDGAANVSVTSEFWRDAGYLFGVNAPKTCNKQMFGITESGDVHFGASYTLACGSSLEGGTLLDTSTASGHHSLDRAAGYYLTIAGGLGARDDAFETDGGRPLCDGGAWTSLSADGGCYYNHASAHGDVNIASKYPMRAGVIAEVYNPVSGVGAYTDHRAFWDWNGAYSQNHGLSLAQFPPPNQIVYFTRADYGTASSNQQFRFGAYPSSQMYDFSGLHWYYSDGTAWRQFLDTASVVSVANGGTGAAPGAGDLVLVSDSTSAATWRSVPDCADTAGNHLNYTASSNTFSCGTTSSGGSGGAPTTARYWVGAAEGMLSAEENLGALATGLVLNTAGTPSAYAGSTCGTNQYASSTNASGALTCSQPAFANISGTVSDAQLASNYSGVGTCTNQFARALNDNAAPTCASVVSADLNITTTSCSNQFVSAIGSGGVGTCTTSTLTSAQFANQGTATQVLHGNAAGNPTWAAVALNTAEVSGTLPVTRGGTGLATVAANQVYTGTAADILTAKTLPSCSNGITSKLLYDNTTQTWSCGVDQTGGGGGSVNFIETSLALDGAGVYSVVVTGQAWVVSTSKITCTPFGTTADGLTPEAVAAAALVVSWSTPVVGIGFTAWVDNPRGLTGTVRIHCSGA
jgi:hypothetical protein